MKLGVLAVSALLVMAGQTAQDDVKKELDRLQGSWAITLFNGEPVPSEAGAYLVFTGDKYEQWTGGSVDERGSIKLDPKAKPASIDLVIVEGGDAGKTQLGVYEISGDTATVALSIPGSTTRPSGVAQGELNVVLKKQPK